MPHSHTGWRPMLSVCVLVIFVVLAFGSFFPVGKISEEDGASRGGAPSPVAVVTPARR